MKFLIEVKKENYESCKKAMEEFLEVYNSEAKKYFSTFKGKIVIKVLPKVPQLVFGAELIEDERGIILSIPFTPPDFKAYKKLVEKITGKKVEFAWKIKFIENIKGYLIAKNIKFEDIKYLE
jgi:hypothetical protein